MAQLKDLLVTGASRLIGDVFVNKIQVSTLHAPTSAGGASYGAGTDGQVLKTNGTTIYWGADSNSVTGVKGSAESTYRTGQVSISAANIGLGNVENTKLSTWTGTTAITTIGTLSTGNVPWARLSNIPIASTTNAGIIQIGTGAANAAAGNHSHDLSIATDSGNSSITLAHGSKYKLTAGGKTFIFTMPASGNTDTYVSSIAFSDDSATTANSPIRLTVNRTGTTSTALTANIPKVSSVTPGVVPKGTAVTAQTTATKFLREDGNWATPSYNTTQIQLVTWNSI